MLFCVRGPFVVLICVGCGPGMGRKLAWLCKKSGEVLGARMVSSSVVSDSSRPFGLQPSRLLCPLDFPGLNTGVGCCALLQGIFITQWSNSCFLCLLHYRRILYPLSHWGCSPGEKRWLLEAKMDGSWKPKSQEHFFWKWEREEGCSGRSEEKRGIWGGGGCLEWDFDTVCSNSESVRQCHSLFGPNHLDNLSSWGCWSCFYIAFLLG